jgi:hypothetical protein
MLKLSCRGLHFTVLSLFAVARPPYFTGGRVSTIMVAAYYFPTSLANPFFTVSKSQLVFSMFAETTRGEN